MGQAQAQPQPIDPAIVQRAAEWMARLWSGEASDADRAAYIARETEAWQFAAADFSTRTGEIREVTLPDSTRIILSTAPAIDLQFNGEECLVVLRAGEILVTTAPDPAAVHRPFRVQSRHGTVEALGTRFTARQDGDVSRVAVFEGAVEIRPRHGASARLKAGQRTVFSAEQVEPPAAAQEGTAAWSRGLLLAENMRVADFLAELGRYRPGLLRCAPAIAELRVSGVFSLHDTDRALLNLTLGLPVDLVYRTRYWVTVAAR